MKWWHYFMCIILVCGAIFCGIKYVEMRTAESYIVGEIQDKWTVDAFRYNSKSIVLNEDIDNLNLYFYKTNLEKQDFNGEKNKYEIFFNNKPVIKSNISAGSVYFEIEENFKDTQSNIIVNSKLRISVKFLNDRTELYISCVGEKESAFFSQLFSDKGFFLKILEIKEL